MAKKQIAPFRKNMNRFFLLSIFLIGLVPAIYHLHLVEKDFLEILGAADGIALGKGYCFLEIVNYQKLSYLTGITARPPLIQLLLAHAFQILGHNLLAIYLVYLLPRIFIYPTLYAVATFFFPVPIAYLAAVLPLFFPFFETYALATLKADVFAVGLSLFSVYMSLRFQKKKKAIDLFLASLFLSLNLLTKETALPFSFTIFVLLMIEAFKSFRRQSFRYILILVIPPIMLIGPFVYFSLTSTGKLFPSLFATAFSPSSFPKNIITYIYSSFYYTGINFSSSKIISFTSLLRLILILIGLVTVFKRRLLVLILPVLAVLVSISLIHTRVVQGDSVGDREILHRIALVVPFMSLYLFFGIQTLLHFLLRTKSTSLRNMFILGASFLISVNYLVRYFKAPYALDYTDKEFYINAQTIFSDRTKMPYTEFKNKNNLCIIKHVPEGAFLIEHYRPHKVSAFPEGYKEVLIGLWFLPILVFFLFKKILFKP